MRVCVCVRMHVWELTPLMLFNIAVKYVNMDYFIAYISITCIDLRMQKESWRLRLFRIQYGQYA